MGSEDMKHATVLERSGGIYTSLITTLSPLQEQQEVIDWRKSGLF